MKKIIVVEDQGILRDSISYQLDKNEYDVILKLADANMAYDACKRLSPDLVLMDVYTENGNNGIDAAKKIKKDMPDIKIIIMTGMPEVSYIKKAKEAPAQTLNPSINEKAPEPVNAAEQPLPEAKQERKAPEADENQPFMQWTEVLEELKQTDMPLAAILQGSQAFVRGEFVLIKSQNSVFEQFIKKETSHSSAIKAAILKISGKKYRLGRLISEQDDKPVKDPLTGLINKVNKFNQS